MQYEYPHILFGAVKLWLFLIPTQALWLLCWRNCCLRRQNQTMQGVWLFGQHSTMQPKFGSSFRSTQTRQVLKASWMFTFWCALKWDHKNFVFVWGEEQGKNDRFLRPCIKLFNTVLQFRIKNVHVVWCQSVALKQNWSYILITYSQVSCMDAAAVELVLHIYVYGDNSKMPRIWLLSEKKAAGCVWLNASVLTWPC